MIRYATLVRAAAVCAVAAACACSEDGPRSGGASRVSALGFEVRWLGPSERYPSFDFALEEVDAVGHIWLYEFGGEDPYRPGGPLDVLRKVPIVLVPSRFIAGGETGGRTWPGVQVDIAMDCDYWDPWTGRHLVGISALVHQWLHVRDGAWHP